MIWLEGDASAPLSQQLLDLQALLENWKSVIARVESLLPNEERKYFHLVCANELAHMEMICAIVYQLTKGLSPEEIKASVKYNDSWEITFTTDDLDYCFSFIWKNNTVRDLTLY